MKKTFAFMNKHIDNLGLALIALNLFSSLIISGIAKLDPYGSLFNYLQFALLFIYCAIYCLVRRDKNEWKNPYFVSCLLFLLFSLITIILNPNKIDNAKITIITIIQWFVIFLLVKNHRKVVLAFLNVLNYFMFFITTISLFLFIKDVQIIPSGERYAGIFANSNMGPVLCCIAIAMSLLLFFYTDKKIKKLFLFINIILQILFIRVGLSRAGNILMWVIFLMFTFIATMLYTKRGIVIMRNMIFVGLAVFFVYTFVGDGFIYLRNTVVRSEENFKQVSLLFVEQETYSIQHLPTNLDTAYCLNILFEASTDSDNISTGMRNDESKEASNQLRLDMLKYGAMAVKEKPLLGQGIKNLPDAVRKVAGKDLNALDGGGVHNSYLQLLISNGIIGFLSFAAIHLAILYSIWKRRKKILAYGDVNKIIWFSGFFALYAGLLVYGLFESILIMNSAFVTSMFALVSGGLLDE